MWSSDNQPDLDALIALVRQAPPALDRRDVLVAIERTGRYHLAAETARK